jgi:hypothetical protein
MAHFTPEWVAHFTPEYSKLALGLIEAETTRKKSKNIKRLIASIYDSYRELIPGL